MVNFGPPSDQLYAHLEGLTPRVEAALLAADVEPDQITEVLADIWHTTLLARIHLRESEERAEKAKLSARKSAAKAKAHVEFTLSQQHQAVLADELDPHGYYVYCLWGDDPDRPLYVGQSSNILARLGSHLSNRSRRAAVRRISLTRCKTHTRMCKTEMQLIDLYQPPLNVVGVRRAVAS